ncbi:AraC family transcriptional regulator [Paenibacillus alginolyticus]|uniref:helix-turn-helix transcriptional regulator n=1 Tax=Paenibacillus alginolyticus TaxID=59839 RepID=UPI0004016AB0|nr:helix-turn-helix domain-containing protein [Paenibacillus alginolyticus]MCY9670332.1 AraC family transcriptional regulator [Paenibacillus alginolyticus]
MNHYRKQMMLTTLDRKLPLYIETFGFNLSESEFNRPDGYHCYHWLQTTAGAGELQISGKKITLSANEGILLKPHAPHFYMPLTHPWSTWYITFGGSQAHVIISALDLAESTVINWDHSSPLATIHKRIRKLANHKLVFTGLDTSATLYRFLTDIKKFGHADNKHSLSNYHEKLFPLMRFLENVYNDAAIGLSQMADHLHVSPQHLNYLFRAATGMSPYQFLIHLRIQKAKELLINKENLTVKVVASQVGFLDSSHFVSTFRKLEGITPEQYRNLY